jgi:GTP-binding protein EngB required for normal cell division
MDTGTKVSHEPTGDGAAAAAAADSINHAFRHHLEAAFCTPSGRQPSWLVRAQRVAASQLRSSGLGVKVPFLVHAFESATQRADEPFEVFVIGEGKFGKSTLINALFGRPVARTDFLPKTWCFNRYVAVARPSNDVKVFLSATERIRRRLQQTLGPVQSEERGLRVYSVARDVVDTLMDDEEKRISDDQGYISPIQEIEWEVPQDSALLPGLRLVDTQGLRQIIGTYLHRNYLKWQYERADAVIWLLACDRQASWATDEEMSEATRYGKPIILVLSRWDKVDNPDLRYREALARYGSRVNDVVPLSALRAFLSMRPPGYVYSSADYKMLKLAGTTEWSDLRALSGIDKLIRAFEPIAQRKWQFVRSVQTYSTRRRQQTEYRAMFVTEVAEIRRNLDVFRHLLHAVESAQAELIETVETKMRHVAKQQAKQIDQRLSLIDCYTHPQARALLQLDTIALELAEAEQDLAAQCTHQLNQIVASAHRSDATYTSSEFGPTGSTAFQKSLASLGDISVDVRPSTPQFDTDITVIGFWDEILIFAGTIPLIGGLVKSQLDERTQRIRSELRNKIVTQLEASCASSAENLKTAVRETSTRLTSDIRGHMDSIGGEAAFEQRAAAIEAAATTCAVPPLFIDVPLRWMRALRWPQAR